MNNPHTGQHRGAIVTTIIVLVLIGAVGCASMALIVGPRWSGKSGNRPGLKSKSPSPVTFIYDMGDFMVNLSEPNRYLKASVSTEIEVQPRGSAPSQSEIDGKPPASVQEELDRKMPRVRDIIIERLSASSFRDLLTPRGRRQLKTSLANGLNSIITRGRAKTVYFTNFTMQ